MSKKKVDPRAAIAMDMTSNIYMNSTTKFTPTLAKLDPNNANDNRLK